MKNSQESGTGPHSCDVQKVDIPSLVQMLHVINEKLTDCRENFLTLYPKRPVTCPEFSCADATSEATEDEFYGIEYADDITNN